MTTRDIAKAAVDAAFEMLKARGLAQEASSLARDLREEVASRESVVTAVLITPSGKAGELAQSLKQTLEKRLGHSVSLTERADPSLIGGAVLEFGDARVDLSVRGSLENAVTHLTKTS